MRKTVIIIPVLAAVFVLLLIISNEKLTGAEDINRLITINDLSIVMKMDNSLKNTISKVYENDAASDYYLKIDVSEELSMRGEAVTEPGKRYRLSFTLKNIDADPVISYSFWRKPVTSLRHFTFRGENGNPPNSATQEFYHDWVTFEEVFETKEGEDSFMLTLHCTKGIFFIREIRIEEITEYER